MDIEFQKSDFDKMMFRIDDMPDRVDPVEHFPKLKKWPEFSPPHLGWSMTFKNKVFRWIVLVYDKESPFRLKVADVMKRKLEAAKYVKLITSLTIIDPVVRRILQGEHAEANKMIMSYVRMHRQSQYALVVGLENMFYNGLFNVLNGEVPKGNKQITTIQKEFEDAVTELLNQDNNAQIRGELLLFVEEERLSDLRPEGIAEIFAAGNKPFESEEVEYK